MFMDILTSPLASRGFVFEGTEINQKNIYKLCQDLRLKYKKKPTTIIGPKVENLIGTVVIEILSYRQKKHISFQNRIYILPKETDLQYRCIY